MSISPKDFGLHARTVLEQLDESTIAIVINRKSRIIMADGKKIVEKAQTITKQSPDSTIALKTTASVCSKTRQFLSDEGILVIPVKP